MLATLLLILPLLSLAGENNVSIQHDAEYAILEAQNGEAWIADDQAIDKKLAEIRKKNGGKPPNIVYIALLCLFILNWSAGSLIQILKSKIPNL